MSTGIRFNELRLSASTGSKGAYGVSFRVGEGRGFRPLSVIAGPSLTGKTSIADFIKYCLGDDRHPQHPEVLASVRSALLEAELNGQRTTIERAASGGPSTFASVWDAGFADLGKVSETRISAEPPSNPDGLSQYVLAACDLNGIELPEAPTKADSPTQLLSIRDLFKVMFVPNDRLDNKNLVYEQSHHIVRQKFLQTIDVMFGVHDSEGASVGARFRAAQDAARAASQTAASLRRLAEDDYPRGVLALAQELADGELEIARLNNELTELDREQRSTKQASARMRRSFVESQERATAARVRVRDRRSLLGRLSSLRGQYADDKKKLNFLRDAERLFDPLQVVKCPACFSQLAETPTLAAGVCSLCGTPVDDSDEVHPPAGMPTEEAVDQEPTEAGTHDAGTVLAAEIRAVSRRLDSLNEYYERLDAHLKILVEDSIQADEEATSAAAAVDAVTSSPSPWLALRDDLTHRIGQARLATQSAQAGLNVWRRVEDAEANRDRLAEEAQRVGALRRNARNRPDRSLVVRALSGRFGEILSAIKYPKLSNPYLDSSLVPHVRGLPYTDASSGGLVLISIAWHLSLWEIAHELEAAAPGVLVLDSPQKNLGHGAVDGDPEFSDGALVENFYKHVRAWLSTDGVGAQLIVIDNSPPQEVNDDVVVRYTRDPEVEPYGLITDAVH